MSTPQTAEAGAAARVAGLEVVTRPEEFRRRFHQARATGRSVGLVPTMGYLHEGHASLIRRSANQCDVTAVTVFVNPLQFDRGSDLAAYPTDPRRDHQVASKAGADLLFTPSFPELFPEPPVTQVAVPPLAAVLEGASRPGHFTGVATIVAKLFNLSGPCRAYFGEKDFQQLAVVKRLVNDLSFPVEVAACPTIREADGLACSSRNARLSQPQRQAATGLWRGLTAAASAVEAGERDIHRLRSTMAAPIEAEARLSLDYAEVVDAVSLGPPTTTTSRARLLVAAYAGDIRLIDNLGVQW